MNPFHDLGRRYGGALPAAGAPGSPLTGAAPAGGLSDLETEHPFLSLSRFARVLSLGTLGLAGLLSFGVGGVVLVQGYAFPAPKGTREPAGVSWHSERASSPATGRRGPGASSWAAAGESPAKAAGEEARRQRSASRLGTAPRRPGSIPGAQLTALQSAHLETAVE